MSDLDNSKKIFSYLAPAKVNLCLKIGKKRSDGYHELASIIGFTEFGDTIKIEFSNQDNLLISGHFSKKIAGDVSENLVAKSVKALRKLNMNFPPLKITIDKQIPVGGGLGGGSSDAATVFLALNDIFKLNMSKTYLENIAIKIGADIPACLNRNFVMIRGIGNQVNPLIKPDIPQYVVLANPNSVAQTKNVFKEFDNNNFGSSENNIPENLNIDEFLNSGNDLEKSARKIHPNVGTLLDQMKRLYPKNKDSSPLCVQMSGSGASCFALFNDPVSSKTFCQKIKEAGYWSVSTKFIS